MLTDTHFRLPQNLLKGCSKLQFLSLSHNKLQTLERFQFSELTSLEILNLSHNRISLVHEDTFHGLGLKTLLLNNNNLKTLSVTPFLHLPNIQVNVQKLDTTKVFHPDSQPFWQSVALRLQIETIARYVCSSAAPGCGEILSSLWRTREIRWYRLDEDLLSGVCLSSNYRGQCSPYPGHCRQRPGHRVQDKR